MNSGIPEKITNFNVYNGADKLVGIGAEVKLPDFEAMTEKISGAGIAGEYESITPGHFGSQEITIPYRMIDSAFNLAAPTGSIVILRASQQYNDVLTGLLVARPLKITIRGCPKKLEAGKVAVASPMDTSITLEITYIKIESNGEPLLEYDKINFIYAVNGVDYLAIIKSQI